MNRMIPLAAAAALVLAAPSPLLAQDHPDHPTKPKAKEQAPDIEKAPAKTLAIGDEAPAIDIAHWLKGDKVTEFEDGKVYVVEFWATWCPPCRESMPHLSKLQDELNDYNVTLIGISDEDMETVTKFLGQKHAKGGDKTWNDIVAYTLTTDPDRSAHADYMEAANQTGIPTAFIVGKDQHIEWIGHPMSIDRPLKAVVNDSWDRAKHKSEWEAEQVAERELMKVRQPLFTAIQNEEWDKALEIINPIVAKSPKSLSAGMTKFQILLQKGDGEAARTFGGDLAKHNWDNAMILNMIAWTMVDREGATEEDAAVALEAAARANELSEQKDPAILDTLARCHYQRGDLKNAVKFQEMAVKHAGDDEMGQEIKDRLKQYQDELAAGDQ